jgi:hypothetical protein
MCPQQNLFLAVPFISAGVGRRSRRFDLPAINSAAGRRAYWKQSHSSSYYVTNRRRQQRGSRPKIYCGADAPACMPNETESSQLMREEECTAFIGQ